MGDGRTVDDGDEQGGRARGGRLRRAVGAAALTVTLGLVGLPTAAGVQSTASTGVPGAGTGIVLTSDGQVLTNSAITTASEGSVAGEDLSGLLRTDA